MEGSPQADVPLLRVSTGVPGLDDLLHGGLPANGVYLVRGGAGTGKTTLGVQFLLDGVAKGEVCLFVSLSQSTRILTRMAASHGWSLEGIRVHAITPREVLEQLRQKQDVFVSDEVELVDIADRVRALVEEIRPDRLVFDSLSFVEMLATVPGRFEQELAALVDLFGHLDVTALLTINDGESNAEMVTDGVLELEHMATKYGTRNSRITVTKIRGSDFVGGEQDYQIERGGLKVYPRLTLTRERRQVSEGERPDDLSSGSAELDDMVGGGLGAGTSCLVRGPSGSGKTTVAAQYAYTAAARGTRVLFYLFEELASTFLDRSAALGMDLRPFVDADVVRIIQIERPAILPGEFAVALREGLDWGARVVVVDSLSGYYQAMPSPELLMTQIRDVVRYMNRWGVISILTVAHPMSSDAGSVFPLDVSETVDVKIVLRFYEVDGELRKGLAVVKRRDGSHRAEIRTMTIGAGGVALAAERTRRASILDRGPQTPGADDESEDPRV
jgi:circadian clock protein KaiC